MKTRLFLAALCLFLLPMFFAPSSSQFSVHACSGYNVSTGRCCECEEEGCQCGDSRPTSQPPGKDTSLGSESLIILAALMLWLRIRANQNKLDWTFRVGSIACYKSWYGRITFSKITIPSPNWLCYSPILSGPSVESQPTEALSQKSGHGISSVPLRICSEKEDCPCM